MSTRGLWLGSLLMALSCVGVAVAQDASAVSAAASVSEPQRALQLRSSAGLGFGSLAYERPAGAGVELMPTTVFGAAEVALGVHVQPRRQFSLDIALNYASSLGLTMRVEPLFGLPEEVPARFQRGEFTLAPVIRLGATAEALRLAIPIGLSMLSFAPTVGQYSVEPIQFGGPSARAELRARFGDVVSLRVGPELQWIAWMSSELADEGACCQGFAAGGRGELDALVGSSFRASIAFRQNHAFAPLGGWRFKSVERLLIARLAWEP
ncbi:MAG: hypothetical protein OEZ06_07050 [Myxococcales bacterium]|nr:hypothetical protein [Myxococcales bacterium]